MNEQQLKDAEKALTAIFALPLTQMTIREVENLFMALTQGNKTLCTDLLDSMVRGQAKPSLSQSLNPNVLKGFNALIEKFNTLVQISIEIHERGDFLNLITSDMVRPDQQNFFFVNRVRRVDGQEFRFIADPINIVNLLDHYLVRLAEIKTADPSKKTLEPFKQAFAQMAERLKQLT